jgi:hypothetical protein
VPAGQEALDHVVAPEPDAKLEAGHARLRDHEQRRAHANSISDVHGFLSQPLGREILAKHTPGQFHAGQFLSPVGIMLRRVSVHRLVRPAVHREIGLPVAVKIQLRHLHPARNRLLENSRADGKRFPLNFARQSYIHRKDFC